MPTKQKNQHLIPRCYLANFISSGRGKQLSLAAFSLETNSWEIVKPD
jgi:hypothetical protein